MSIRIQEPGSGSRRGEPISCRQAIRHFTKAQTNTALCERPINDRCPLKQADTIIDDFSHRLFQPSQKKAWILLKAPRPQREKLPICRQ